MKSPQENKEVESLIQQLVFSIHYEQVSTEEEWTRGKIDEIVTKAIQAERDDIEAGKEVNKESVREIIRLRKEKELMVAKRDEFDRLVGESNDLRKENLTLRKENANLLVKIKEVSNGKMGTDSVCD